MTSLYATIIWLLSLFGSGPAVCSTRYAPGDLTCDRPFERASRAAKVDDPAEGSWDIDWGLELNLEDSTSDEPISNGF